MAPGPAEGHCAGHFTSLGLEASPPLACLGARCLHSSVQFRWAGRHQRRGLSPQQQKLGSVLHCFWDLILGWGRASYSFGSWGGVHRGSPRSTNGKHYRSEEPTYFPWVYALIVLSPYPPAPNPKRQGPHCPTAAPHISQHRAVSCLPFVSIPQPRKPSDPPLSLLLALSPPGFLD